MAESKNRSGPRRHPAGRPEPGFGGVLEGLADLIGKLGELTEKGSELSRTGQFGGEKGASGVYGFSVKVGVGDQGFKVEPFGNIAKDKTTGKTVVQDVREPLVDVFEESDYTLVVAEMPGVGTDDVQIELEGDLMIVSAKRDDRSYQREVSLPRAYSRDRVEISASNGMVRIKCRN